MAYISSLFPPFHLLSIILCPIKITSSIRQPILTGPTKLSTTSHSSAVSPVYPQLISHYVSTFPYPITFSQPLPFAELTLPSARPALLFSDLPQSFILKGQHLLAVILHPVRDHLNPPKKQPLSDPSTTLHPDHYYNGSLNGWSQIRKIGVL